MTMKSPHYHSSLSSTCSLTMEKTLAVTPRQVMLSPRLSPIPAIKFPGRSFASSGLTSKPLAVACVHSSRVRSVQCSASSAKSSIDKATFLEAAEKGNLVPIFRCVFSDHLTPVLAYRCLVREDDRDAPSFLFESVEPGLNDSTTGRYSVIGAQPSIEIVAKENMVTIMDHYEGNRKEEIVDDPMTVPKRIMEDWNPQLIDDLPEVFCGKRDRGYSIGPGVVHFPVLSIFLISLLGFMVFAKSVSSEVLLD